MSQTETLGEHQPFRQRDPIQSEHMVDGELGPGAAADGAGVFAPRIENIEDCRRGGDRLRITTDEAEAVTLQDLPARAGHRRIDDGDARTGDFLGKVLDPIRLVGAGAENDHIGLCRTTSLNDAVGAGHHLLQLRDREDGGDDDPAAATAGDLGDGVDGLPADVAQGIASRGVDVIADDREAGVAEAVGEGSAHEAEADQSDGF